MPGKRPVGFGGLVEQDCPNGPRTLPKNTRGDSSDTAPGVQQRLKRLKSMNTDSGLTCVNCGNGGLEPCHAWFQRAFEATGATPGEVGMPSPWWPG